MIAKEELKARLSIVENGGSIRVNARETTDLEFKEYFNARMLKKSLKTIAAFANQKGGLLVFGVSDSPRNIVGLTGSILDDGAQSEILSSSLLPVPETQFVVYEIRGLKIGVLSVEPLGHKPCIATRKVEEGSPPKVVLKKGCIYARRRGQTSEISGNEFTQLLGERDKRVRDEVLSFMVRGAEIGFDRAIVADPTGAGGDSEGPLTYYVPAEAAAELNIIDRAKLVEDGGAPAYELQGRVELTVPAKDDPRIPMLPRDSANEIQDAVRSATLSDLPFEATHLRKVASHLGFWTDDTGDKRHTGFEPLSNRPIYYREGRAAVERFAADDPAAFMEVCASQKNRTRWLQQNTSGGLPSAV